MGLYESAGRYLITLASLMSIPILSLHVFARRMSGVSLKKENQ